MNDEFEKLTTEELKNEAIGYMGDVLDLQNFDVDYDNESITVNAANGDRIVFTYRIEKGGAK